VARDRQRAKQRKQRREPSPPKRDRGDGLTPEPRPLHRENVPGPVEHTGEVDEFEAALVAGADGQPETDADAADRASVGDDVQAPPPVPGTRNAPHPGENAPGRGGNRFLNFLRASWGELQLVQWPDRRQVGQATMVVLGFVVVAGAFLGLADFVAQQVVDFII
jgi:preprotein translocase SecE subunit